MKKLTVFLTVAVFMAAFSSAASAYTVTIHNKTSCSLTVDVTHYFLFWSETGRMIVAGGEDGTFTVPNLRCARNVLVWNDDNSNKETCRSNVSVNHWPGCFDWSFTVITQSNGNLWKE